MAEEIRKETEYEPAKETADSEKSRFEVEYEPGTEPGNENSVLYMNSKLKESFAEAKKALGDEDKVEKLLQRMEKKLKTVPVAGGVLAYIPTLISLIRMFIKKKYTEIPLASILAILAALVYWLGPLDVIADFIPALGFLDDAGVLAGAVALCKTDLDDYITWRKNTGREVEGIPDYKTVEKELNGKFGFVKNLFSKWRKH